MNSRLDLDLGVLEQLMALVIRCVVSEEIGNTVRSYVKVLMATTDVAVAKGQTSG